MQFQFPGDYLSIQPAGPWEGEGCAACSTRYLTSTWTVRALSDAGAPSPVIGRS